MVVERGESSGVRGGEEGAATAGGVKKPLLGSLSEAAQRERE